MIIHTELLHCDVCNAKHGSEMDAMWAPLKLGNCALADCRATLGSFIPKEASLFKVRTVAESRLSITTVQKEAGQSEASVPANSLERGKRKMAGSVFNGAFP